MAEPLTRGYRLGILCDSTEVGGAEQFLVHLVAGLPADVEVAIFGREPPVLDTIAAARPGAARHLLPLRYLAALRVLHRVRPDIAHANLPSLTSCRVLVLAALTLRIPVVLVDHLPTRGLTWKGRLLQRMITRCCAGRVAVGDSSARQVERHAGLRPGSVGSIRNGIPAGGAAAPAGASKAQAFGFLGRLEPQKGLDVLIEALALVPGAGLEIMGSGSQRAALQAAVARLGLEERVRFTPGSPDTAGFWSRIETLVLPSRYEGMPLVILEALRSGHPVIASDVGSISEALDDEVAILVPPDDVQELAAALRAVAGDPGRLARMRAAARSYARSMWSAADMVAAYDTLYRSALRRRRRPTR